HGFAARGFAGQQRPQRGGPYPGAPEEVAAREEQLAFKDRIHHVRSRGLTPARHDLRFSDSPPAGPTMYSDRIAFDAIRTACWRDNGRQYRVFLRDGELLFLNVGHAAGSRPQVNASAGI